MFTICNHNYFYKIFGVKKTKIANIEQPFGMIMAQIGKSFLHSLNNNLHHLEIERNYYALLLIENAKGNITQQELAYLLDTDKVSVVRIVDHLSDHGYVKRVRNEIDRRKYSLVLTAKAQKETSKIKSAINEITSATFNGISASQIKSFFITLEKIKVNLTAIN